MPVVVAWVVAIAEFAGALSVLVGFLCRITCPALALTGVRKEDQASLNKLLESVKTDFNERYDEVRRRWGGGILGAKTLAAVARQEKARAKEAAARA